MFQWLWNIIAIPFGYIMRWAYLLVHDVLHLPLAYIWAMLLFALVTRLIQLPLTIKQQKSMGKTAALNVLMERIKKTYAKDQKRQQAEMQKLQETLGINPLSGCLPMLIQFPILFGLVEVIYKPLTYMLRIPADFITKLSAITTDLTGIDAVSRTFQNDIIAQIKTNYDAFAALNTSAETAGWFSDITNLQMSIGSLNLWETPALKNPSLLWLLPIFSIVTMLLSSLISMKTGAEQQQGGTGKIMMIAMALMFGVFSFSFPAGFSLYWGLSNLIIIGQTFLMRKLVDTEGIKQKVLEEYAEKKKAVKDSVKKVVKVVDEKTGSVTEKKLSQAELARMRLQKAREIDAERYSGMAEESDVTEETLAAPKKDTQTKKKK